MNGKLVKSAQVLDDYEKRFARERFEKRLREPWCEKDREEIFAEVKNVLSFDKIPTPVIKIVDKREEYCQEIRVEHFMYESWADFYGIFSLYMPPIENKKAPLVFVCPGHSAAGRMGMGYQRLALCLARLGAYVIINDNIGQGSRASFGHWESIAPFFCGLTLQGMIIKETLALIDYAVTLPFVDTERIAAAGNSGGGTISAFLAALEPRLAAVVSCGYPSEFSYIFSKERSHCACNILPGVLPRLEMWEIYSLRAPKPMLLSQGLYDQLIPNECFLRNGRKVKTVYEMFGKKENFDFSMTESRHPWDTEDIVKIGEYLKRVLELDGVIVCTDEAMSPADVSFPSGAISTDELAERLTGMKMPIGTGLEDIFPPMYGGKKIKRSDLECDFGRGDIMRALAQMEAVLKNNKEINK